MDDMLNTPWRYVPHPRGSEYAGNIVDCNGHVLCVIYHQSSVGRSDRLGQLMANAYKLEGGDL